MPYHEYYCFALSTDPLQHDRAVEINIFSAKRPHMRAFHFAWVSFFTAFLGWFAIPPLMPTLRTQLQLTQSQIDNSNIVAVSSTILGRLITGPLCDHYGSRAVQATLLVLGTGPIVGSAFVTDYVGFMVARFFIGLIGCSFIATVYWTSIMFASNVVGSANAITAGWGNLGAGAAYLIMPLLYDLLTMDGHISDDLGWRITLCFPAVLMVIVGISLFYFSDDCPYGNYADLKKLTTPRIECSKPKATPWKGFVTVSKLPVVWLLGFQYACSFGIELQVHNVLSLYYYEDFTRSDCDVETDADNCRLLTQTQASLISSLFGLMCIFSRAAGGCASDLAYRWFEIRGRIIVQFLAFAFQTLALYLYSQSRHLESSVPLLVLFGFFVHVSTGSTYAIVPYVSPQHTGVASGIVGAGGSAGALAWGFLFKAVRDRAQTFEYLSIFVGVAAVLSWFIVVHRTTSTWAADDVFVLRSGIEDHTSLEDFGLEDLPRTHPSHFASESF